VARLEFALICTAASEGKGGTLSMLDAGIDQFGLPTLPGLIPITFVFKVRWDEVELGRNHQLVVAIDHSDPDIDRLASITLPPTMPQRRPEQPALPLSTQLILNMPLQVTDEGLHTVVLSVDDDPVAITPFIVTITGS
jgi:hypothetical protein